MIRTAMVGLGKMGLSHLAIVRAHPGIDLVAGCDATAYLTDILSKHAGLKCYADFDRMLDDEQLDALVVATPSKLHAPMVEKALDRGLHVFCEKPFVLDVADGERLVALARDKVARQPGRLPLPLRRRLQGGGAPRRGGRARRRPPRARRGLRPGRAAPQGRHLALGQERGRRRALRLRLPRDRPGELHRRHADLGGRRRAPQRDLLARRRRRGLLHAALRRRRERPALRELERRELSQDVDQDLGLGHQRPHHRRPPGVPDLPARAARGAARASARAGPSATRPTSPTRSGSTCAARSIRRRSTTSRRASGRAPPRRREHLPLGARRRPRRRDDRSATAGHAPSAAGAPGAARKGSGRASSNDRRRAATMESPHAWTASCSATTSSSASTTCRRRRRARSRCASRTCRAIIDVLDAAYEEGIRTFMCTTHDRVAEICDHFRANPDHVPRLPVLSRACRTRTSTPTPSPSTA